MPMYEYKCDANGQVIEVVHRMSERFETWAQLCDAAKQPLGDTPPDAPVVRLMGGGSATNAPNTLKKQNAVVGERSKHLKHGATVSPMRTNKF